MTTPLRGRLREALSTAMKSRDRTAASALRSTLAAIDNAQAVDTTGLPDQSLAIELSPKGAGAAEIERRALTEAEVEQIVRSELAERESAAAGNDRAGWSDHADRLRHEARVIRDVLSTG
jgi:uncharacterized protein YqeY